MKRLNFKVILLSCVLLASGNISADDFSDKQISNLKMAYDYGKKSATGKSNADQIGYVMAAIMWKESTAGIDCGSNGDAVGAFQNRTSTVKARLKQEGINKSHKQIATELQNKTISAKWAYEELSYWIDIHKGNIRKAIASYNAGWKYSKGQSYSKSIMNKADYLKNNGIIE